MRWDFWQRAGAFLRPGARVLCLGAEGVKGLLESGHPLGLLCFALPGACCGEARRALAPLGAAVEPWEAGEALPFGAGSVDFALALHEHYCLEEIRRVVKPGGFFLTQQVGGQDCDALALGLPPDYNLENQLPLFRQGGFRVVYADQCYEGEGVALRHRFIITASPRGGRKEGKLC